MSDQSHPNRPAPRVPAGRGSLAFAAAQTPVQRWSLILQEALDAGTTVDNATLPHRSDEHIVGIVATAADSFAQDLYAPLQAAILTQRPMSLVDALTMAAVAHELAEDIPATLIRTAPELAKDARAIHLALGALVGFILQSMRAGEAADLAPHVHQSVLRATTRNAARFTQQDAA